MQIDCEMAHDTQKHTCTRCGQRSRGVDWQPLLGEVHALRVLARNRVGGDSIGPSGAAAATTATDRGCVATLV